MVTDDLVAVDKGKFSILGVQISAVNNVMAIEHIIKAAHEKRPYRVTALAVHGVMTGVQDEKHRYRLNQFDLVLPDGQPVRWALNFIYRVGLKKRVYGPDLMVTLCSKAADQGIPVFLYGSTPETLQNLVSNLQCRFPNLNVAGTLPSLFRQITPDEQSAIQEIIRNSGARIVFVGLGCPRQEVWVYENVQPIGVPLIAVGAAFPFHAGTLPQAPSWMQNYGLEWLFRLYQEPDRLWRRYILLNPVYILLIIAQWIGFIKHKPVSIVPDQHLYG